MKSVPFDNFARRRLLASALQQKTKKDRTKKDRFSNFSRKWTKKSFPSVTESVVNDWKPPSHLGTSAPTAPLKKFKIRIPFGNIAARPALVVPEVVHHILKTVYLQTKLNFFSRRFLS